MNKYIDAEKLKAEIERRKSEIKSQIAELGNFSSNEIGLFNYLDLYDDILSFITSLQQEQPEYGYLSTTYIYGKRARWNVGDTLAYYLCTSDEEGEIVIGKITKVEFSNEEGWVYTFEDESTWDEQSLIEEEAYKIIKNGK